MKRRRREKKNIQESFQQLINASKLLCIIKFPTKKLFLALHLVLPDVEVIRLMLNFFLFNEAWRIF